jgi:hypothetical protein
MASDKKASKLDIDSLVKISDAYVSLVDAKAKHDFVVTGRQTSLSKKLRDARVVLEFQLEDAVTDFVESEDAKASLDALRKANEDRNRKLDEDLKKNPSPNAPYHKPRAAAKPLEGTAGLRVEQK